MRTKKIIEIILALGILASVVTVTWGADAPDSQQDAIGQTPPRLSLTKGEVSFWREGAQDWSQAQINTPLAPGDLVYSGPQGTMEIQIGSRAFVRGWAGTQVGLENHEPDFLQFKVTAGNVSFDLRTVEPGRTVEVDTPNAAFIIDHEGYYRVNVSGERTSFITRRGGQATISYPGGETFAMGPSEEVIIEGVETPRVASYAAPQLDEWDKWNYARTDHLLDAVSARYVPPGVYGVNDLDLYGRWRSVPTYGAVWFPGGVSVGWAPYTTGSWMLDPYYGWTWVDTAPWGWAPYHYGRWVSVDGFWGWAPGPVVVRPAYSPALVAFFGGPGVSVGIGVEPVVGWVALGWGEPCVPWWGPTSFRHRPWWGGWGGPRVVNNVVINKTTVVNVQEINVYRNTTVRNAVVAVNEKQFGRGPIKQTRVGQVDEKNFRPIHTAPQVTTTPASFVPRESRGIRPPEKVLERSVVATRPSHSRAESASGPERKEGAAPVPTPAPRIVSAPQPQQRETAPALQRPPYGQSKVERRTTDRAQMPAPPRVEGAQRPERTQGGAPSVTDQESPRQQGRPQMATPSPATPQPSTRQPGADRSQPSASPKPEGTQGSEKAPEGTPSADRQRPAQQQRQPQVVSPSQARPQASARQPEATRAQPSTPPKVEGQQSPERAFGGTPSATRQTPQSQQRQPQVASPPAARPQSSGRSTEAQAPGRVLPGEPANRLAPNRGDKRPQQSTERKEELQSPVNRPEGSPKNPPQKRPGN